MKRWIAALAGLLLLAAGVAVGYFVLADDDDEKSGDRRQTVRFQPPTDPGPDPFTPAADTRGKANVPLESAGGGRTGGGGSGGGGTGAGPFGGTGSDLVCDRELLIRSLRERPDRLAAWARVLRIQPDVEAVARLIRSLQPATLVRDTRVTNHRFANGQAVGYQAILQAGTAVLVGADGTPVARCRCGNPLLQAVFRADLSCIDCPRNYQPPPPCRPASQCYRQYPDPPPVTTAPAATPGATGPSQPAGGAQQPSAAWTADATQHRGKNGQRFSYRCPPPGAQDSVWGTDVYTDDSSVCNAAIHSGKSSVSRQRGGTVTIEIRPGQNRYTGSVRNGITSSNWGAWQGSFVVVN